MPENSEDTDGKVSNRKLEAIEDLKSTFDSSKNRITSWTTSTQRIPYANGGSNVNPSVIVGGEGAETLSDDLTIDVWDSPAAEDYRTRISNAKTSIDSALSTMETDLTSAKSHQENVVGTKVSPNTPEATWGQ